MRQCIPPQASSAAGVGGVPPPCAATVADGARVGMFSKQFEYTDAFKIEENSKSPKATRGRK